MLVYFTSAFNVFLLIVYVLLQNQKINFTIKICNDIITTGEKYEWNEHDRWRNTK